MNAGCTVLALLRVGTRRCRLAAALVAVAVGLMGQTASQAFADARQTVLYLNAPAVSTERASRAGEVAAVYAEPGSPANRETLAWLDVPGRPAEVSMPPAEAEAAFASVTAPEGERSGGVTADAALRAGEVMIAQIEASPSERSPSEDSPPEAGGADEEMADAGAVRPQLGDGTQAPAESVAGPATQPEQLEPDGFDSPTDVGTPEYASRPTSQAPAEPSGDAGLVVPAPSSDGEEETEEPSTELAVAPSDTSVSHGPALGTGEDEPYGPTGPISDVAELPQEGPYPDDNDPEAEPTAGEDELAQAEPVEEEPPEEEPAEANPPAVPTGAETGPTSEEGDEVALVPVGAPTEEDGSSMKPPPADGYDDGSDDLASADPSPAPEPTDEVGEEQAGIVPGREEPLSAQPSEDQSVVETQVREVMIVQESTVGETAEAPPVAATPASGGTNPPEEATEPPSVETPPTPTVAQTPTVPAPGSADEPAPEPGLDLGDDADDHSGPDAAGGTGRDGARTTPEPTAAGSGGPTNHTDQPPSATPPEADDEPTDGQQGIVNEPAAGEEAPPSGQPGTRGDTTQGDAQQPPVGVPNDPAATDPRPRPGNPATDRRNTGNGRPVDPMDRLERRTGEADGGAEAVQERARAAVDTFGGGDAASAASQGRRSRERAAPQSYQRPSSRKAPQATPQRTDLRGSRTPLKTAQRGARGPAQAPGTSDRAEQTPAVAGQEDAEAGLQEGSPEPQYPIEAVDGGSAPEDFAAASSPATAPGLAVAHERGTAAQAGRERVAERQAAAEQVREDRIAERQTAAAAERSAERQAAINAERQAERRTRRRAERQPARQVERRARDERRAAIEEQEFRTDRRAERQAARQTEIEQQAAETRAYERLVDAQPVYREPMQQVLPQQLPPAPQVRTRQPIPAEQDAPQRLAPTDGAAAAQQPTRQGVEAQVAWLGKSINPAAAGERR